MPRCPQAGAGMGQSFAQIYLHIVFSTKNRQPFLRNPAVRGELHAYLGGACKNLESPAVIVGGTEDHVHVLASLARTRAAAVLIRELKRESSKWVKGKGPGVFQWQDGYGAFSVSASGVDDVRACIANQEEHHRR